MLLAEVDAWPAPLRGLSVEHVLLPMLVQLVVIILLARVFASVFRRMRQPSVVGEIAAGLVLGPSLLGKLAPNLFQNLFHPTVQDLPRELVDPLLGWVLTVLSQLGLIFLLFLIGLDFDFSHLRGHGKSALAISIAGIVVPFGLGVGVAQLMLPVVGDRPPVGFALFLGTALAITAIPVLGRMMMELGITRSRLATLTISAAACDDATGWILLASVAAGVRSQFEPAASLFMLFETIGFALFMIFAVRPLLGRCLRHLLDSAQGELGINALALLLGAIFLSSLATNAIGIGAIFGAFLCGAALSGQPQLTDAINRRLRDFVTAFFVPLFFTYTGLRTDIGTLESLHLWLLAALVSAVAILGKLGGCSAAAWLTGLSPRESACVGAMMNTRGLIELIVINVGKDLGVIPDSVFCMLVFMALLTTFMTTPLLLFLMPGTELEPYIRQSGFLGSPEPAAESQPTQPST